MPFARCRSNCFLVSFALSVAALFFLPSAPSGHSRHVQQAALVLAKSQGRETAWNFAYGSNLDEGTRARRRLNPCRIEPASVRGWELSFDLQALPYLEPAFAIVRPSPEGDNVSVHGVCLELDREGWLRLLQSEGAIAIDQAAEFRRRDAPLQEVLRWAMARGNGIGRAGGYRLAPVTAQRYGNGDVPWDEAVYALAATDGLPARGFSWPPSERYWRLIRNGAARHKLASDYRTFLSSLPRYSPSALAFAALPAVLVAAGVAATQAFAERGDVEDAGPPRTAWPELPGPLGTAARGRLLTGVVEPPVELWASFCSTPRAELLERLRKLTGDSRLELEEMTKLI